MKILKPGMYYGVEHSILNQAGLILSEYQYETPETDWHYHENPYFMYVLQGKLMDINRKGRSYCPGGSLIFHNWQETHRNTKESRQARGFHIEFSKAWFEERRLTESLWEGSSLLSDPRLHQTVAHIFFEFRCRDRYSSLALEALVLQLCTEVEAREFTIGSKEPAWVAQFRQLVQEEMPDCSLLALSECLGVHPVHLSRSLPKYLKTTLGDYIRREKIRKALGFFGDPGYSLSEITYLCGFADQSHFTRTFRLYFGEPPGVYRKEFLKD